VPVERVVVDARPYRDATRRHLLEGRGFQLLPERGGDLLGNPGNVTGTLCFIPLFCWFVNASSKGDFMDGRGLACAIAAGVVQHLGVFSAYAVNLTLGQTAALVWVPFMAFIGTALAWMLSKAVKSRLAAN